MTSSGDIPEGFALYRPDDAGYDAKQLLVPAWLHDELSAARERRRKDDLEKIESASHWPTPTSRPAKKSRLGEIDVDEEHEELSIFPDEDDAAADECAVYARDEPLKMLRRAKQATPDRDRIAQLEGLYLKLKEIRRFRTIAPQPEWRAALARLDCTHPHFTEVTQLVRERLILAEQSGRPAHIPPLLLLGTAGVGKTHYAKALAAAIGTSHRQLQFDTALSDAALVGNEKRWANTSYGVVFEEVVLGSHANPVIVLDELDKALRDKRSDPLAPLHSLLEPVTSRCTRDVSLDFEFDASHVIWIATANYPWLIPQPLRTRMREFSIGFPTAEQSIQIVREVARSAIAEIAPAGFEVREDVGVLLGHLTAREAYQATADAIAHAVAAGRLCLERSDFSAEVRLEDEKASGWLH